jgi:hypothetical protein
MLLACLAHIHELLRCPTRRKLCGNALVNLKLRF